MAIQISNIYLFKLFLIYSITYFFAYGIFFLLLLLPACPYPNVIRLHLHKFFSSAVVVVDILLFVWLIHIYVLGAFVRDQLTMGLNIYLLLLRCHLIYFAWKGFIVIKKKDFFQNSQKHIYEFQMTVKMQLTF